MNRSTAEEVSGGLNGWQRVDVVPVVEESCVDVLEIAEAADVVDDVCAVFAVSIVFDFDDDEVVDDADNNDALESPNKLYESPS